MSWRPESQTPSRLLFTFKLPADIHCLPTAWTQLVQAAQGPGYPRCALALTGLDPGSRPALKAFSIHEARWLMRADPHPTSSWSR